MKVHKIEKNIDAISSPHITGFDAQCGQTPHKVPLGLRLESN